MCSSTFAFHNSSDMHLARRFKTAECQGHISNYAECQGHISNYAAFTNGTTLYATALMVSASLFV